MKKNILDVAKFILENINEKMSIWKLHKLCFYCQAWSYVWDKKKLFNENFEAWSNGPVSPVLYETYNKLVISLNDFSYGDSSVFTEDEEETIKTVIKEYASMEAYDLQELVTHEEPWIKSRNGLPNEEKNIHPLIEKKLIKKFYTKLYNEHIGE